MVGVDVVGPKGGGGRRTYRHVDRCRDGAAAPRIRRYGDQAIGACGNAARLGGEREAAGPVILTIGGGLAGVTAFEAEVSVKIFGVAVWSLGANFKSYCVTNAVEPLNARFLPFQGEGRDGDGLEIPWKWLLIPTPTLPLKGREFMLIRQFHFMTQ